MARGACPLVVTPFTTFVIWLLEDELVQGRLDPCYRHGGGQLVVAMK